MAEAQVEGPSVPLSLLHLSEELHVDLIAALGLPLPDLPALAPLLGDLMASVSLNSNLSRDRHTHLMLL